MDISNLLYVEQLFNLWQKDPSSLPEDWNRYFSSLQSGEEAVQLLNPGIVQQGIQNGTAPAHTENKEQRNIDRMILAFRNLGVFYANINPLGQYRTPEMKYLRLTAMGISLTLDKEAFGFTEADMDRKFLGSRYRGAKPESLRDIMQFLHSVYSGNIGYEFTHIKNRAMLNWIMHRIESEEYVHKWTAEQKIRFQKDLIKAEALESFIQSNFIGQKRFSLEGGEGLVVAMHFLIYTSLRYRIKEVVLGMAHRGRLNLFINALRKPARELFSQFIDKPSYDVGSTGDVKYHLGHSFDYTDPKTGGTVHLSLVANPSHLEAVDPVVEGKTRGLQRVRKDVHRKRIVPVLIHGDAAFSGQGVVAETFNLSQLKGYRTGGTIHIIVNNQIGFTTASRDARSTFFSTDFAKSLQVPILHVNGDDPEAIARCMDIALAWRQKFGYDIVIDLVCYRRRGHNETDEPSFTHPLMYSMIQKHPSVATQYGKKIAESGEYPQKDQVAFQKRYLSVLKDELDLARKTEVIVHSAAPYRGAWSKLHSPYSFGPFDTRVPRNTLDEIAETLSTIPEGFNIHSKLNRVIDDQKKKYQEGVSNWGFAEALSLGSLLKEGHDIRLSGEDSARGTFSHRHAQWWDISATTPTSYIPLQQISPARFSVYDSPLSEFAVLGFEYGYSLTQPNILSIWEAQFGDFANGAQVIIDQFISSGNSKWTRSSGIVLLLPHGYEGQGPEHSSAHLGRFLQLCAEDNMQIVNCTTPAQFFHVLRRQLHQPFRRPLVVMSPKSLLRHPEAISPIEELSDGSFHLVIDDPDPPQKVERVLLCSGKVYYDLKQFRQQQDDCTAAIVRIEQLYPWPKDEILRILHKYPQATEYYWVQEEARNHGAWSFISENLSDLLKFPLRYVGRRAVPAPSSGSYSEHVKELQTFLQESILHTRSKK